MGIKQLYNDKLRKLPNEYGDVSIMLFFDICSILQQICVNIIIFICAYNYVEDPQMIQLFLFLVRGYCCWKFCIFFL